MGRGQYGYSHIGQTEAELAAPPPPPPPPSPLDDVTTFATAADPWAIAPPTMPQRRPWTEEQKRDFQRALGMSAIGSVAGAVLWKAHRIWGFILGGMAGGGLANVIFAPTSPDDRPW